MKITPDWITGGDPYKTEWIGGKNLFDNEQIQWHSLGEWILADEKIIVEYGSDHAGKLSAVRLRGSILHTARGGPGEIGWCIKEEGGIKVPFISPQNWSPSWIPWLHADISNEQLFEKLGLLSSRVADETVFISYPTPPAVIPLHKKIALRIGKTLTIVSLGFFMGWSAKPIIVKPELQSPSSVNQPANPAPKSNQTPHE
jgi:hypothetical protein